MTNIKKLKKNQISINDKVYTKDVTAMLIDDVYVPKTLIEFDTFRNKIQLKSKLLSYTDLLTDATKYTSSLITIISGNQLYKVCESYLKRFDGEFMIHQDASKRGGTVYISIHDKYITNSNKFNPEKKIYNINHYSRSLGNYSVNNTVLDFINYTFGFELETSRGFINEDVANNMGFAVLYDGSITGAEYVSNVMTSKNLESLKKFLKYAGTCTDIDHYCSLHIHFGNIVKGERELLSMYCLFQRLTDELNQLIIPYKKDTRFLADKLQKNGRDHCKNLPKLIDRDVKSIYKLFRINDKIKNNFIDSESVLNGFITSASKWTLEGRYYNVNFMNYICKPFKQSTVEIRSLQSTYNFDYVLMWLLINASVIDYALNNYTEVMDNKVKIELEDCLKAYIKDKVTLEITLQNIKRVKEYFYNNYYLHGDSMINVSRTDELLKNIIIPYDNIFKSENITNSFYDLVTKKQSYGIQMTSSPWGEVKLSVDTDSQNAILNEQVRNYALSSSQRIKAQKRLDVLSNNYTFSTNVDYPQPIAAKPSIAKQIDNDLDDQVAEARRELLERIKNNHNKQ